MKKKKREYKKRLLEWFTNRVGKKVVRRYYSQITQRFETLVVVILTEHHAKALWDHANSNKYEYAEFA